MPGLTVLAGAQSYAWSLALPEAAGAVAMRIAMMVAKGISAAMLSLGGPESPNSLTAPNWHDSQVAGPPGAARSQPVLARADPDAEAAARFHREILPHLEAAHNLARYLCRDGEAAQDVVQEAFLRAYRAFGGFRGGNPRAWIFAIVRNCTHTWRARRQLERSRESGGMDGLAGAKDNTWRDEREIAGPDCAASDAETPEAALIRRTEAEEVREVIAALPDVYREVLVLREFEDLSYREIAEITDAPIGTVMARLSRARRLFGEHWTDRGAAAEEAT